MDSLDQEHLAFDALQPFSQSGQKSKMNREQALRLRAALMYDLLQAEALLRSDPDVAALRLDGALRRIVAGWFAAHGLVNPPESELLQRLDALNQALGAQVRLALHAPNVAARLAHCRALLRAALADDANEGDGEPHTTATTTTRRQLPIDIQPDHPSDNRSVHHASIR